MKDPVSREQGGVHRPLILTWAIHKHSTYPSKGRKEAFLNVVRSVLALQRDTHGYIAFITPTTVRYTAKREIPNINTRLSPKW